MALPAMRLDRWFQAATGIALLGWVLLLAGPDLLVVQRVVVWGVVVLLGLIYARLLSAALRVRPAPGADRPGFFTLRGVVALFQAPVAILAAWVHLLAFDLMVGVYIRTEGARLELAQPWLIPCLLLALLFGPLGLLLFLLLGALLR